MDAATQMPLISAFAVVPVKFAALSDYFDGRSTDVDMNHAATEEERNAIHRQELFLPGSCECPRH
jgi:hypothetical protein